MSRRSNDLEQRALQLIFDAGDDGILQSEMWKRLGLSSREGSRLAHRFEERGTIERRKVLHEGRWTYKLYSKRQPVSLDSIKNSPCLTCEEIDKCFLEGARSPIRCEQLTEWIRINVGKDS
jgi:predicted transcriptional regulator